MGTALRFAARRLLCSKVPSASAGGSAGADSIRSLTAQLLSRESKDTGQASREDNGGGAAGVRRTRDDASGASRGADDRLPVSEHVVNMTALMNARVHMGHRTQIANRKMAPYILGVRNSMHVIDLDKTIVMLRRALAVLREMALRNVNVMWLVANKKVVYDIVSPYARRAQTYLLRGQWVGGTLTNALHSQQAIRYDYKLPGCLFVLDTRRFSVAVREANLLGIPVIGVVDTDCDPSPITYPIPGNDESLLAIKLYAELAMHAMLEGRALREARS